jgi:hypothetical protein
MWKSNGGGGKALVGTWGKKCGRSLGKESEVSQCWVEKLTGVLEAAAPAAGDDDVLPQPSPAQE